MQRRGSLGPAFVELLILLMGCDLYLGNCESNQGLQEFREMGDK